MKLDIRTSSSAEPQRQAYSYLTKRFGENRAASRYEEAVLDVQSIENFHYRPSYDSFELFDTKRTAVVMADWYALTDPRQFYYGTYNISRAALEAANAKSYEFAETQGLFAELGSKAKDLVSRAMIPLRHYEWGANLIAWSIVQRGYGTAITSAAAFFAMDRLGTAQSLTKLALALDGQSGTSIPAAKKAWMDAPSWQGARKATEDLLVVEDWFEALVGHHLALDGVMRPLVWGDVRRAIRADGGMGISLVTDMISEVTADQNKWLDSILARTAKESDANKATLSNWLATWTERAREAATPLATECFGAEGNAVVDRLLIELAARATKLGLDAKGGKS